MTAMATRSKPSRAQAPDPDGAAMPCTAIEDAMNVLGRAWAGAVLQAMMSGAERFSDIRRAVHGITDAALTTRLSVRYTLTRAGRDTAPILDAIRAYAADHRDRLR